jgi:hypothetical protein
MKIAGFGLAESLIAPPSGPPSVEKRPVSR